MIKNEKSIIIQRPIEKVFAFVSDLQNATQWQSGVLEVRRVTEGPLGIGTQFAFVRKFMGRKMEAISEFVAYEPNSKVVFKNNSGPMDFENSYLFEATDEDTRLTSILEMQPKGFISLAEPLIDAGLKREMETAFGDLKDLLESRVPAASL